ncbi:MAG TPA: glycosyltransferase family 4 protein, partial [Anaerolineales bacterium]|nr:glycosyltransferase family 4 protein [Anaerolineales bacterium]
MKVLLVSNTDWYLFRFRLSLAEYLRARGWDVILVSPPGEYVKRIEEHGFRWAEWQVGRQTVNPLGELRNLMKLRDIFKREKPDLVHLHTIKPVIYGSLAATFAGLKAIVRSVTGRGYVFLGTDLRARLLRPIVKGVYRFFLRAGGGVTIFENQADLDYFVNEGLIRADRATLIEGVGVDTEHYHPLPEPEGVPTVLLAGRLLWDKGVGEFVEAARQLKAKMEARFILVGENDAGNPANIEKSVIEGWVKEGLLEWWGWQSDMRAVFAACHVVALPSYGEGIPTVLLEAAACGRAIVATDVSGCRDVVRNEV